MEILISPNVCKKLEMGFKRDLQLGCKLEETHDLVIWSYPKKSFDIK
jgi:hypothetical protein